MPGRSGYKPKIVCELLDIGDQTLRYWRRHLEPAPKRSAFSAGDLLAFRVLKALIQHRHLTVEVLEQFPLHQLFAACQAADVANLAKQVLLLDEGEQTVRWGGEGSLLKAAQNYDIHTLFMAPVLEAHQRAFLTLGNP